MIDDALIDARAAKDRGLVDHLVDVDGLRDLITDELGDKIEIAHDYGKPAQEQMDLSSPLAIFSLLGKRPEVSDKPAVALIYADGMIIDGEGGVGLFGGVVGSHEMREALRIACRDEKIKAVVIRIDSPGGSAVASEAIWQAARRVVAAKKPLIVSIGGMAASGGYYVASAGDCIFADPSAIVGSIGVVGGKFVMKDLYDKIGLTTEPFNRGRNADLFSATTPFTDRQRRMVLTWMKQTYDQFTERVMTTRGEKIRDIDAVARGRIFLAKQAKELGMVDQLGGLRNAMTYAADKASLKAGEYDVRILPNPKTLADLFAVGAETRLPSIPAAGLTETSLLRLLSPAARRSLGQQIQMLQLLQERPVMLVAPYVITVH